MDDVSSAATATATAPPPPPLSPITPSLLPAYYTQEEIDEDHICDSKYRDLITQDFVTENPRLFRGRYFERESLQRLLDQHDTTRPFIIQRVYSQDGSFSNLKRLVNPIRNPAGGVGDDLWVPCAEIEAAMKDCPCMETIQMIREAVERYHTREERRQQFESMREKQSEQAEFERSLQQQFTEIAEHRQRRLDCTTIPEVATLQKELDGIMSLRDLGRFQQRSHLLRRIEILENEHTQAEFRRATQIRQEASERSIPAVLLAAQIQVAETREIVRAHMQEAQRAMEELQVQRVHHAHSAAHEQERRLDAIMSTGGGSRNDTTHNMMMSSSSSSSSSSINQQFLQQLESNSIIMTQTLEDNRRALEHVLESNRRAMEMNRQTLLAMLEQQQQALLRNHADDDTT